MKFFYGSLISKKDYDILFKFYVLDLTGLILAEFMFTEIDLCRPFNSTTHSNHLAVILILTFREDAFLS